MITRGVLSSGLTAVCLWLWLPPCAAGPPTAPADAGRPLALPIDSGWVRPGAEPGAAAYTALIVEPGASWVRLIFDRADLGAAPDGAPPTALRLTSLFDGSRQHLDDAGLERWQGTSAYFNGPAVLLELFAGPGATPSRVAISRAVTGPAGGPDGPDERRGICGGADDRVASDDPRVGRLLFLDDGVPAHCTTWIIDDTNRCLLTAAQCPIGPAALPVVEFNVPGPAPCCASGAYTHPPPCDQYVLDPASSQSGNGNSGQDWAYFGCFPGTETLLSPFQAQGAFFALSPRVPRARGQMLRLTGYGRDPDTPERDRLQQTSRGPYVDLTEAILSYQVDAAPGDAGGPVCVDGSDLAVAIHGFLECTSGPAVNVGTGVNNPDLLEALENPRGVCVPPLTFSFPEGLPELLSPDGDTVLFSVAASANGAPVAGTGQVFVDDGSGVFASAEVIELDVNEYQALFPPVECGTVARYYFAAAGTIAGTAGPAVTVHEPLRAPKTSFEVLAADAFDFTFDDDFKTDQGWTVVDSADLTAGAWERGVPMSGGDRGEPPADADGSGQCYVTGLDDGDNDVDGGATTLVSPVMDASTGDPHITYWRWYSNHTGQAPFADVFMTEVSDDGGQTWTVLEQIGPGGPEVSLQWFFKSFRVADFVEPTATFRIRFTVSDADDPSIVEAGIDGVRLNGSAEGYVCIAFE